MKCGCSEPECAWRSGTNNRKHINQSSLNIHTAKTNAVGVISKEWIRWQFHSLSKLEDLRFVCRAMDTEVKITITLCTCPHSSWYLEHIFGFYSPTIYQKLKTSYPSCPRISQQSVKPWVLESSLAINYMYIPSLLSLATLQCDTSLGCKTTTKQQINNNRWDAYELAQFTKCSSNKWQRNW